MSETTKRIKVDHATDTLVEEIYAKEISNMSLVKLFHYNEMITSQIIQARSDTIRDILLDLCDVEDIRPCFSGISNIKRNQIHYVKAINFDLQLPGYPIFHVLVYLDLLSYDTHYACDFRSTWIGKDFATLYCLYHLNDPPIYERQPIWILKAKNDGFNNAVLTQFLDWITCGNVSREKYPKQSKYGFSDYQIITPIMVILTELNIHKIRQHT